VHVLSSSHCRNSPLERQKEELGPVRILQGPEGKSATEKSRREVLEEKLVDLNGHTMATNQH
jgi:hypothetical protein